MEEMKDENNEDEIVIDIGNREAPQGHKRKNTRIDKSKKIPKNKKPKKRMSKKKKIIIALSIIGVIILSLGIVFGVYIFKSGGNVKDAVLNMATDIVGKQDPIFVLVLGVSEDISAKLTDTILLCGYNPNSQKAIMLSIPRDTFVGNNEASANGYDKINAQFQKSADKTVEKVQLITGVKIDYFVIVRNISLTSIFETVGSVEFDVPINMDYDDPTQNLHIHLKKGKQTLEPNQIEQLLRFRHNNNGTSYPSSYGDNDYGRMRTQRDFIKAVLEQKVSFQNLGGLKDMASTVYTNLQTNMSGYTVLDYVPHALKFNTSNLRTEQLPGQSALINELWFYKTNFPKTRRLVDELMIYLEIDDDKFLESHYKYADDIKGVKPDGNWVPEEIIIDDDWEPTKPSKNDTNTTDTNTVVDKETCNHNYGVVENTATCEFAGTIEYKCTLCGHVYTESSKALGHVFKDGVCTRPGCKEKDPTTHKHDFSIIVSQKDATCTEAGSIVKKCSGTGCNETKTETTKALGHSYKDGICTRCNAKEPVEHKHDFSIIVSQKDATCTEAGNIVKKCSGCDETKTETTKALGHSFGDWVIKIQATETTEGSEERTCSVCQKTESRPIPKLTPKPPVNPGGDEKDPSTSGEGGNESSGGTTDTGTDPNAQTQ